MLHADNDLDLLSTKPLAFMNKIENLKLDKMLDTLGQAWQSGSTLAALARGRATQNKHRLCCPLLVILQHLYKSYFRVLLIRFLGEYNHP